MPAIAIRFLEEDMVFICDGSDTPKLASAWLGGGRERKQVETHPLAHARGHGGDEESGGDLASKWFDQMRQGPFREKKGASLE